MTLEPYGWKVAIIGSRADVDRQVIVCTVDTSTHRRRPREVAGRHRWQA